MTYTQFDDPQTCLHKEGKNYMIIMSKKQLQKFKGKKKMLGKHNGEMKISHNYQRHSRKINFH